MDDIDIGGIIAKVPISYTGDPCSYKYLELPNGLKAILISDEKSSIAEIMKSRHRKNEELSMVTSSTSLKDEEDSQTMRSAAGDDLDWVEGKACLTFECGSIHDEGFYPGIGDLCRQLIHAYNLEYDVVPTSKIDLGQTTFYHIRSHMELDPYLNSLAQIMRKPNLNLKYIRQFMTNPVKSSNTYFKNRFDDDEDFPLTDEVEVFSIYKWYELFQNISPSGRKCLAEFAGAKTDKDIGDLVEKYWQEHYVPRKASLVVKSNASLAVLEKLLIKYFAPLKNRDEVKPSFSDNDIKLKLADFEKSKRHKWMEFQGKKADELINDEHVLLISWVLSPEYWTAYLAKPHLYISWALNNQGRTGLIHTLQKRDWIMNFRAGCNYSSYHRNDLSTLFQIRVKLTDEGLKHKEEVLKCIFTAIRNVGIHKDIFEQVKLATDMSFRKFDFESLPYEYTPSMYLRNLVDISSAISKFPPENVIIGELIFGDFDSKCAELIGKFKKLLVPESADFILISSTARYPNSVEKYSQTIFFQEDTTESFLNKCNLPSNIFDFCKWKVTRLNMYNEGMPVYIEPLLSSSSFPKKLSIPKNDFYEIWHMQDTRAKEMAVIGIHLINSIVRRSALNVTMVEVMAKFLHKCLISELYDASLANYQCKSEQTDCGMTISVMGPRFAIDSVIATVLNVYSTLQKFIDEFPFTCKRIYQDIQASLSQKVQDGTEIVDDIVHSLLIRKYNCMQDKYTATKDPLNISKLKRFVTNFQKRIYAFFYVQGNFTAIEAESLVRNNIADKIKGKHPINPKKAVITSVLWPDCDKFNNVVRIDTVAAWAQEPICQMHYHCGYINASNIVMARIKMKLLQEELDKSPYDNLPFKFEPEMRIIHGSLDFYFSIFLDDTTMNSQNTSKLSWRSKLSDNIDLFFIDFYRGFLKRLSDSAILDCIFSCRNERNNYINNLLLKEEVAYFMDKVKSLDFTFGILDEEERCFNKLELEIALSSELSQDENNSVRLWIKDHFNAGGKKIFIFLEKSGRPLLFDYAKKNDHDLIIFKMEDPPSAVPDTHKYIYNFQEFKRRLPYVNGGNTLEEFKEESDEEYDEESEEEYDEESEEEINFT